MLLSIHVTKSIILSKVPAASYIMAIFCVDDLLPPERPVSEHLRLLKRVDLRCVIKFCIFCVFEPFYYFKTE